MSSICRNLLQFRGLIISDLPALSISGRVFNKQLLQPRFVVSSHIGLNKIQLKPCSPVVANAFSTSSRSLYPANNKEDSTKTAEDKVVEAAKPSIFKRFKQMYKDYWYVLIPVHLVTSAAWFGSFYYAAKSGVDVVALLEYLGVNDKLINPLRNSSAGYVALAYAMYKVATPARYAVTLGGTTVSIKYLMQWGYIKPVPTKAEIKVMYHERKERFNRQRDALRQKIRQHRVQWRKRQEEYRRKHKM